MTFLISDLKTRLAAKMHGTTIDKVTDIYGVISEAAGNVLLRIDPQETKRVTPITNALYDQVYSYVTPSDLKGNKIISIRSQINRNVSDRFTNTYSEEFDLYKDSGSFAVENNGTVKTISISKSLTSGAVLNDMNGITDNGTWAVGSFTINLVADTLYKVTGSGSLKFDITVGGTTAYLENSTMTSVDLSSYVNVGSAFVWVYIPSTTIITSLNLRWGSSSSNYYSNNATTAHDNTGFVVGWNLVRFDWNGATQTGTSVNTAINYARITFNYNGTATTSCRVDNIVFRLPSIYNLVYYSKYLFRNSGGTWIEKPTTDTDIINLDTESYNVLFYEVAYLVAHEMAGEDSLFDVDFWEKKKKEIWDEYMLSYRSETIKPRTSYYRF